MIFLTKARSNILTTAPGACTCELVILELLHFKFNIRTQLFKFIVEFLMLVLNNYFLVLLKRQEMLNL